MIKAAFKQAQIYHDHFKGQLNSIMWLNPMFTWKMVANLKYMAPSCIFKLPKWDIWSETSTKHTLKVLCLY